MSELEPTSTELEPTATERLRALLDERGVEWETDRSGNRVMWGRPVDPFHDTMEFKAVDNALPNGGLNVHICGFTPEQAVEATLGSCNCSNNCTNGERTETCELTDNGPWGYPYVCSACGASFDADVNGGDFNFCPSCGRRIEVDDG